MNDTDNLAKAGGRVEKWGPTAHTTLLTALLAVLDAEGVKASKHQDLIKGIFDENGLDFTWEGIR
jgi:hypothetical protein